MKKISLIILLLLIIGCESNTEKGVKYIEKAKIFSSDKEKYNYHKAIKFYEKAIKNGEVSCYYELAQMYMSPAHFYPKDYRKAKIYLDLALENGDERANYELGILEMKGFLGKKNEIRAKNYFEKINENDYLVRLYGSEDSMIKDYKKAFEIAIKNTSKENNYLNTWLGYFYENGLGVQKNLKKANEYNDTNINLVGYKVKAFTNRNLETLESNIYRVHFKYTVFNGGFISFKLPTTIEGRQRVYNLKSNINPVNLKNDVINFKIEKNKKETEIIVSVDIELMNNLELEKNNSNSFKMSELDLLSTSFVNANDSQIEKITKNLKKSNDIDTLANIAHFTAHSIEYQESIEEKSALFALKNKIGDCSESSFIFASLARNLGYPTKLITGFVLDGVPHMWNEVYTKEYGWLTYDSLNSYSSFHNGFINYLIIIGDEKTQIGFRGGIPREEKISIELIR